MSRLVRNAILVIMFVGLVGCAQVSDSGLPQNEKPPAGTEEPATKPEEPVTKPEEPDNEPEEPTKPEDPDNSEEPDSELVNVALKFPADLTSLPILHRIEIRYWSSEAAALQSAVGDALSQEGLVEVIPGGPSSLDIPQGDYVFESRGFGGNSDTLIAFGRNTTSIGLDTESLYLDLEAILGSAELSPLTLGNHVTPGEEFAFALRVKATDGSYLTPAAGYEAKYYVGVLSGEITREDAGGVTIRPSEGLTGELTVMALISGVVLIDGVPTPGRQLPPVVRIMQVHPAYQAAEDWQEPVLIFNEIDPELYSLTGTATDNRELRSLRVYHGSILLGSSNPADHVGDTDVSEIAFTDPITGAWSMGWTATQGSSYTLRAEATDISGNKAIAFQALNVSPPANPADLTDYRTVSSALGAGSPSGETFSDASDNCPASEFSMPGQGLQAVGAGLQAVGAIGGLFLAATSEFDDLLTSAYRVGQELGPFLPSVVNQTVAVLIVDDFGSGVYMLPQQLMHGSLSAGMLAGLDPESELPHGVLVLHQTLELFKSLGYAHSGETNNGTGEAYFKFMAIAGQGAGFIVQADFEAMVQGGQNVGFVVQTVNTNGLDTAGIAARIRNNIDSLNVDPPGMEPISRFVVNMSFVIMPCVVKDDLEASGIRTFEDYVAAVAAVNDTTVDQATEVLSTPRPHDGLLDYLDCPLQTTGGNPGSGQCDGEGGVDALVHVAAAGNFGSDFPLYPAAASSVIAVGSQDATATGYGILPSSFSNRAGVLAPGAMFKLVEDGGFTVAYAGTSFAAPVVSVFSAFDLAYEMNCGPGSVGGDGITPPALASHDLQNVPLHSVFGGGPSATKDNCNGF